MGQHKRAPFEQRKAEAVARRAAAKAEADKAKELRAAERAKLFARKPGMAALMVAAAAAYVTASKPS